MNKADRFIKISLLFLGLVSFYSQVFAGIEERVAQEEKLQRSQEEPVPEVVANRPTIGYKSREFRDPFQTYMIKGKKTTITEFAPEDLSKMKLDLNQLKVQGIIWGTNLPQAIINNRVYAVGDKIEDAEIISIDSKGVNLNCALGIVSLAAPGQGGPSVVNEPEPHTSNAPPQQAKNNVLQP